MTPHHYDRTGERIEEEPEVVELDGDEDLPVTREEAHAIVERIREEHQAREAARGATLTDADDWNAQ